MQVSPHPHTHIRRPAERTMQRGRGAAQARTPPSSPLFPCTSDPRSSRTGLTLDWPLTIFLIPLYVDSAQAARYYSAHLDPSDSPDESLLSPVSPSVQASVAEDTPDTDDVPPSPLNTKFAVESEGVSTGVEVPESPTRRRSSREREARASKRKTGSGTGK